MARRISRQELKRDEIAEAAVDVGHWIEAHWRKVAALAGGGAILALAIAGWVVWSRRSERAAEERLANAIVEFERLQSDGFSDRAKVDSTLMTLDEIARRAGSAPSGLVARVYRGAALVQTGRAQEATAVLEGVVEDAEQSLVGPAHSLLASAYQAEGRTEEAIELLRKMLEKPDPTVPLDQVLLQLGTLYESVGRDEEARQQFQRILDEHPTSAAANTARQELQS